MSRSSSLILLGVLTILAPFSGLPASLRTLLIVLFGAIVLGLGVAERARDARHASLSREPAGASPPSIESAPVPHGVSPI